MIVGARKLLDLSSTARHVSPWDAMKRAYFVSMGNPKSVAFYGSVFTLVVPSAAPVWFYAATVTIAATVSVSWYCGIALMFSSPAVQRGFAKVKVVVETMMGICLIGLGGKLLTET